LRGWQRRASRYHNALDGYRAFFLKWLHQRYWRATSSPEAVKLSDSQHLHALSDIDYVYLTNRYSCSIQNRWQRTASTQLCWDMVIGYRVA